MAGRAEMNAEAPVPHAEAPVADLIMPWLFPAASGGSTSNIRPLRRAGGAAAAAQPFPLPNHPAGPETEGGNTAAATAHQTRSRPSQEQELAFEHEVTPAKRRRKQATSEQAAAAGRGQEAAQEQQQKQQQQQSPLQRLQALLSAGAAPSDIAAAEVVLQAAAEELKMQAAAGEAAAAVDSLTVQHLVQLFCPGVALLQQLEPHAVVEGTTGNLQVRDDSSTAAGARYPGVGFSHGFQLLWLSGLEAAIAPVAPAHIREHLLRAANASVGEPSSENAAAGLRGWFLAAHALLLQQLEAPVLTHETGSALLQPGKQLIHAVRERVYLADLLLAALKLLTDPLGAEPTPTQQQQYEQQCRQQPDALVQHMPLGTAAAAAAHAGMELLAGNTAVSRPAGQRWRQQNGNQQRGQQGQQQQPQQQNKEQKQRLQGPQQQQQQQQLDRDVYMQLLGHQPLSGEQRATAMANLAGQIDKLVEAARKRKKNPRKAGEGKCEWLLAEGEAMQHMVSMLLPETQALLALDTSDLGRVAAVELQQVGPDKWAGATAALLEEEQLWSVEGLHCACQPIQPKAVAKKLRSAAAAAAEEGTGLQGWFVAAHSTWKWSLTLSCLYLCDSTSADASSAPDEALAEQLMQSVLSRVYCTELLILVFSYLHTAQLLPHHLAAVRAAAVAAGAAEAELAAARAAAQAQAAAEAVGSSQGNGSGGRHKRQLKQRRQQQQ